MLRLMKVIRDDMEKIVVKPIGVIHSCFTEKFGIPRQSGMVESSTATLELLPPCNREEMVRGLEQFSHIWVHFYFHQTVKEGWKPTVRPPWLGGQKRVGVFACRSPHRPNYLGMSVVRLEEVVIEKSVPILKLSGIDFLDGTPVLDIKPYVPYSDQIKDASEGFTVGKAPEAVVMFSEQTDRFCREYELKTGRKIRQLIREMIAQDPRPAIQKNRKTEFGVCLWDVNIRWRVVDSTEQGNTFYVQSCEWIELQQ